MAIPFFRKLIHSARSNMKMASWGYCVLVFDSSGEPAALSGYSFACVAGGSGSEFEVWRAKFCVEVPNLVQSPPMGFASSLLQYFILFWLRSGRWYMFDFPIGVSEAAMISSDGDEISIEVKTGSQSRRRSAVETRSLDPLAGNAPVPLAGASRERSRELLEEAFENDMYHFRRRYFYGVP